jgi:hypothetical protein
VNRNHKAGTYDKVQQKHYGSDQLFHTGSKDNLAERSSKLIVVMKR